MARPNSSNRSATSTNAVTEATIFRGNRQCGHAHLDQLLPQLVDRTPSSTTARTSAPDIRRKHLSDRVQQSLLVGMDFKVQRPTPSSPRPTVDGPLDLNSGLA